MAQVLYLSRGKLHLVEGDGKAREIESAFGRNVVRSALEIHQQREWKTKSASPFGGNALWNQGDFDPLRVRVHITAVTRSTRAGELTYALETDSVGGLFLFDVEKSEEKRLFHKESFRVGALDRHPETHWLVCAQMGADRTSHIVVMEEDGTGRREVTEGDCVDEAPAWAEGEGYRIVFQSAGVARNSDGYPVDVGPSAINMLDLQTRDLKTLAESDQYDYLLPHMTAKGDLLAIRRPHREEKKHTSALRVVLDIVLFPFRLARAIVAFLNVFSMMFSQKPLLGSAKQMNKEEQMHLMLRGRMIDARKAFREGTDDDTTPLVPANWELIRRTPEGTEKTLATNVVSFDLLGETIVYTNGKAVYELTPEGTKKKLAKDCPIEEVFVV